MTWAGILFLLLFAGLGFVSRPLVALGIALAGVAVLLVGTSQTPEELFGPKGVSPMVAASVFWMLAALIAYLMGFFIRQPDTLCLNSSAPRVTV